MSIQPKEAGKINKVLVKNDCSFSEKTNVADGYNQRKNVKELINYSPVYRYCQAVPKPRKYHRGEVYRHHP